MDELARNSASVYQAQPVADALVHVAFPLERATWEQYAHVPATIDDREMWMEVAAAYAAFLRVAANDHTVSASFIPTLRKQTDNAFNALLRHL